MPNFERRREKNVHVSRVLQLILTIVIWQIMPLDKQLIQPNYPEENYFKLRGGHLKYLRTIKIHCFSEFCFISSTITL